MSTLAEESLTLCRKDNPALSAPERTTLLSRLEGWEITAEANVSRLRRVFTFGDYTSALAFTQEVASAAEQANHHPAILLEWGRVTISWWTHTIQGLHRNDFIMAARCDRIFASGPSG